MRSIKSYYIVAFFIMSCTVVFAQDTLNSATVEQKSYQLYLDKNWSELIKFGNNAINNGFDYYYLQLRVGIAYYESKNYALALGHFKSALKYNTDDELSLEYLYYCYLYNGRYEDARLLSKQFNPLLSEKIGTDKQSKVGFVMIEGGTKITNQNAYPIKDTIKTKDYYFKPPVYFQLGLSHYVKNRLSLFHAVTYFNQETSINKVQQYQYYLNAAIPLKYNFSISPSVQYVNLNVSSSTTITDTLWPPGVLPHSQPPTGTPPFKTETKNVTSTSRSNYFVGSLAAQKIIKKFTFSIGTTVSNMNDVTQFINSGFLSYRVFGNSKLVLGSTGYAHTTDSYKNTYISASPFIYVQPIKNLSLKLGCLINTKNNIIEDNGYLVNNSVDLTQSRYSALLNFTASKHLSFYGLYQLEFKHQAIYSFDYRYNVIVVGLKIIP
jgi:tetratricopeptide (TPR) repeat protein